MHYAGPYPEEREKGQTIPPALLNFFDVTCYAASDFSILSNVGWRLEERKQ